MLSFRQVIKGHIARTEHSGIELSQFPDRLLRAFAFTSAEARFAVRAYRYSLVKDCNFMKERLYKFVHPLDIEEWWGTEDFLRDASHVALLRVIAEKDANLEALEINGKKENLRKWLRFLREVYPWNTGYFGE